MLLAEQHKKIVGRSPTPPPTGKSLDNSDDKENQPSRANKPSISSAETSKTYLQGKDKDLKLYGSPECRQRIDCLLGLQKYYGLDPQFTPVAIDLRYEVLDKGQADASIVFTTDAQLGASDKYTILTDDKGVLPAGNVIFLTKQKTIDEAGSDYADTIELVQEGLTEKVMQELDARVDLDRQQPEDVAHEYLVAGGYIAE